MPLQPAGRPARTAAFRMRREASVRVAKRRGDRRMRAGDAAECTRCGQGRDIRNTMDRRRDAVTIHVNGCPHDSISAARLRDAPNCKPNAAGRAPARGAASVPKAVVCRKSLDLANRIAYCRGQKSSRSSIAAHHFPAARAEFVVLSLLDTFFMPAIGQDHFPFF